MKIFFSIFIILFLLFSQYAVAQQQILSTAKDGDTLHGFKITALYLNDADEPMGGRFIHIKTGFTLDLLQIESVPQAFIWANTFPVSDKGEPHTQEHLLITKGNKGRELNTRGSMSLVEENAYTSQLHTVYDFNTGAGADVFYTLFEKYLDALLYPDYTDEEVKREVRNWGITENADKTLRIEEKGSVYTEMVTALNNPSSVLYDTIGRMLYGNAHPLSYNAGGLPSGIRTLTAAEILAFHNSNYYLGNMGAITSVPQSMKPEVVLHNMNTILTQLDALAKTNATHASQEKVPPPQPHASGEIALVKYPSENTQETGSMLMAWPATRHLDATQDILLANFLSVFAGDATTNLYKLFIDSKTKVAGFDAQSVYSYYDNNEGQPVFIGFDGIKAENLTKEKAALARELIAAELKKIAAYKDNSPELKKFNQRFINSLTSLGRSYAKFVNSPPRFGYRNTYDDWYNQLQELDKISGFKKSVILKPQFAAVKKMLSTGTNIWRRYLPAWNLTTASPYISINKADPMLIAQADSARRQRTSEEIADLKTRYHTGTDQETILHYKEVYDSTTTALEKLEQAQSSKFIDNPPLTLDDELNYQQEMLPGKIPLVSSYFNNMTSATAGIALNLNRVPQHKLLYLAILPELLTQTGIIKNGHAVSYDDMTQLLQKQILSLASYYNRNPTTGRAEFVVKGAGNNLEETRKAIEWINDVLKTPNWTKENLPRIRDLVEQNLSAIRKTWQNGEEYWANDPGGAYRVQDQPLQLATGSFLTREHNIFRLKWMLKDAGNLQGNAIQSFLSLLSKAVGDRRQLNQLLLFLNGDSTVSKDSIVVNKTITDAFPALSPAAKALAKDAIADLQQTVGNLPDTSLHADWEYLCKTMQHDLAQSPQATLNDLNDLRKSLLKKGNARLFLIGSKNNAQKIMPAVSNMLADFDNTAPAIQKYSPLKMIDERLRSRLHSKEMPVFVGLVDADMPTGVIINSAPLASLTDTSKEALLKLLAAELYSGSGRQSIYTKIVASGLSYGGGVWASSIAGYNGYFAQKTPELPQTLRFVIDAIKHSPFDSTMADYTVSQAIGYTRAGLEYESRGQAMAGDLADTLTPAKIRQFRQAVLALRSHPGLVNDIYRYKDTVYERILPGYGIASKEVKGGCYFVIGSEKQMAVYEAYLKSVEGDDGKLFRLYPRDFWMVDKK